MTEESIRKWVNYIFQWIFMAVIFGFIYGGLWASALFWKSLFFTGACCAVVALNGIMRSVPK